MIFRLIYYVIFHHKPKDTIWQEVKTVFFLFGKHNFSESMHCRGSVNKAKNTMDYEE